MAPILKSGVRELKRKCTSPASGPITEIKDLNDLVSIARVST